jgi:dTDP-4-amino-4,6-dideoxygalactose transaminase
MTHVKMKFPFFDLTRQYASIKDEMSQSFSEVLNDQSFILGDAVTRLEREVAQWLGVAHAVTVSSSADALIAALSILKIGPGDEVITTPFSSFATAGAILYLGAKPVFVDIDPRTYNLDPHKIQRSITRYTKAILPVHLYGQCAEMTPILEIARRHGVPVLEDFAQSMGASDRERQAGTMGTLGVTSFFPNKNLGGVGDGGLIVTNDSDLAIKLRMARVQTGERRSLNEMLGNHCRMDGLQAAYLRVKLNHLKSWIEKRQKLAAFYQENLAQFSDCGVVVPEVGVGKEHTWNQFVIRVPQRDLIRKFLAYEGIPTEVYYSTTLAQHRALRGYCGERGWPESERAARSVLALPIFPELTTEEQQEVVHAIGKVLRGTVRKDQVTEQESVT